jgi:hypothetical protein
MLLDVEAVTGGGVVDEFDAMPSKSGDGETLDCLLASHRTALLFANSMAFAAASFVLMGLKLACEAQFGLGQFERPQPLVNCEKYFSIASFALFLFLIMKIKNNNNEKHFKIKKIFAFFLINPDKRGMFRILRKLNIDSILVEINLK